MVNERWNRVLVIGGGPAGSATAIRLRQSGVAVTLAERTAFPRGKVCGCCLGGAGIDALRVLGCGDAITTIGRRLNHWQGRIGGHNVTVPLGEHLSVSREALDTAMIGYAAAAGVDVRQPCEARIVDCDSGRVAVELGDKSESFDGVVIAAGLNAGDAAKWLPWVQSPHGPFGISLQIDADRCPDFPDDTIRMICDRRGYAGLVRLEDGRIDVAAALTARSAKAGRGGTATRSDREVGTVPGRLSPLDRLAQIINDGKFGDPGDIDDTALRSAVGTIKTTPPLRRSRVAGRGRLLAVGDASGYVEPFTGEGMTWAMQAGIAAADLIVGSDRIPAGDLWPARLLQLLGRRRRLCRLVSSMARMGVGHGIVGSTLSRFPVLAGPIVRGLNRPVYFHRVTIVSE